MGKGLALTRKDNIYIFMWTLFFIITIIAGAHLLMLTGLLLFDSFPIILKVQSIKILRRYKDITS